MFVMLLSTAPCFLNVRNTLNVCVSQTYVARHTYCYLHCERVQKGCVCSCWAEVVVVGGGGGIVGCEEVR